MFYLPFHIKYYSLITRTHEVIYLHIIDIYIFKKKECDLIHNFYDKTRKLKFKRVFETNKNFQTKIFSSQFSQDS